MNGLVFAQPDWFWGGLVLLPLLVLRIWSHLAVSRRLPGLVSPRLSHRLINGATQARRWTVFTLQSLAILCLLAALARPQLGFEETENEVEARNLILAIDTSRSMLSDDLAPNRLDRAKLAAQDIILSLPEDRIGLIAFAGKPFLQAPLTVDHEAVLEAIEQLDTEVIPRGGTNLSAAVNLALETVKEAKLGPGALVLFSDGEALEGIAEIERVRDEASAAGLTLLAVGVGTTDGSIIPDVDEEGRTIPGEFVKDENGQVVRTRLTPGPLQALASKGGAYVHLGGAASLTQVVEQIRAGLASSREEAGKSEKPIERFLWPLSAAFLLLVLSHLAPLFWLKPSPAGSRTVPQSRRRTAAASIAAALMSATLPAGAGSEEVADVDDALAVLDRAYSEERSPDGRAFLQLRIGAQAYQSGNFEKAAEAFGQAAAEGSPRYESTAFYNLGNTLYRRGETALSALSRAPSDPDQVQSLSAPGDAMGSAIREWEGAVEHYETALGLDPDNTRTAHNLDYVKKRLEALKKQQQEQEEQQQQKQDQQKDQDEKKDEQEEKKDDSKKDDSRQNPDQDQQGNQEPQDQDSSSGDSKPGDQKGEDPGQSKPEDPSRPKDPSDSPQDPEEGESEGKDQPPGDKQQPDSGENPPEEPETPQDGKLEANPNQAQPGQANGNPAQGQPMQRNPETGYAPTEARQLLDALADETEVKAILPKPARGERFKNW